MSADVDDSLNLPDLVILRFRDADRTVLAKSNIKIGAKLVIAATSKASTSPEPLITAEVTALEAEFDATGTFTVVRGYDPAHRLFRGRRTETYTQVTASDVAKKVAQRAGLALGTVDVTSTVFDHVSQGGVSDWEFLDGLAREIGHEVAVKDGKFEFRAPKPATEAPAPDGDAGRTAAAAPGHRPRPVPVGRHLGRAGQGGAGPGLGRRAARRRWSAPRRRRRGRRSCRAPASPRPTSPRRSATRCTSPRTCPSAASPRSTPPRRRSRSRSPARPPSSRGPPGATRRSARAPRSRSTTSARRSTASTS